MRETQRREERREDRQKEHLAVPQEVELVNAVVHALHVLEDVGPRVGRGAERGHVAGLHKKQRRKSYAVSHTQSMCTRDSLPDLLV